MYPVNEVARIFFECCDGSTIEMFRAFLRQHPQVRKCERRSKSALFCRHGRR